MESIYGQANFSQPVLTIPWLFVSLRDAALAALVSGLHEALHFGSVSAEQRLTRHLDNILNAQGSCCVSFCEKEAGSDKCALQAVLVS